MTNKELIIKALKESNEPLNGAGIAKATGVDKKEVSELIKELKKEGIVCSPKRCCYGLCK